MNIGNVYLLVMLAMVIKGKTDRYVATIDEADVSGL
jgi:hypothetical protein